MVGVIIQARLGSTRLPEKVLMKIADNTILGHVVNRVIKSELIDEVIIATTTNVNDGRIVDEAQRLGVKCFRGDEFDVLERYYLAAKLYNIDTIVRITSDCPVIDYKILDLMLSKYFESEVKFMSNSGPNQDKRSYPRGLDIEIFSFNLLEDAFRQAKREYQREHVTPYLYENHKTYYFQNGIDHSNLRLTVDTNEDYNLINAIFDKLYSSNKYFDFEDILNLFNNNPSLIEINQAVKQKEFDLNEK